MRRIVLLIIAVFLSMLFFVGCGNKPEEKARQALENYFRDYKAGKITLDGKAADWSGSENNQDFAETLKKSLLSSLEWEITQIDKRSDQEYLAKVNVESLDCKEIAGQLVIKAFSYAFLGFSDSELQQKYNQDIKDLLKTATTLKHDGISVVVKTVDQSSFSVVPSEELENALTGGLSDLFSGSLLSSSSVSRTKLTEAFAGLWGIENVFWTEDSNTVHFYDDCVYLDKTVAILKGSTNAAIESGKRYICSLCEEKYKENNTPSGGMKH